MTKKIRGKKIYIDHEKAWLEYCKFMNTSLEKKKNYHESPHIVINKSLGKIVENAIILKNPNISDNNSLTRKIYYEIDKIGKNVKIHMKNTKYRNVKLDQIVGRKVCILINLEKVKDTANLVFFNEYGQRITASDLCNF